MSGRRALVVAGATGDAQALKALLKGLGHEVVGVARTRAQAAALSRALAPDMVLMDADVPGRAGAGADVRGPRDAALVLVSGASAGTRARAAPDGSIAGPLGRLGRRELAAALEAALEARRGRRRLAAVVAASPDLIVRSRRDGALIEPRDARRRLDRALLGETSARARELAPRCIARRALERAEYPVPGPDGRPRLFELRAAPVDDDEALLLIRDVTERRAALDQAAESVRMLRSVAQNLQAVREGERKEIAREIHDQLGQSLVGLKMGLTSFAGRLSKGASRDARRALAEMVDSVDRTIAEVRRITTKLRPLLLDDLGLPAALDWLCRDFQRHSGVRCSLSCGEDIDADSGRAVALYRIAQEALTNVARHARATRVAVALRKVGQDLILIVRDNGIGLRGKPTPLEGGRGVLGMRERAATWSGEFKSTAMPGKGTLITVRIPRS